MSDEEDNQSLIDEIQALENALDQKQTFDVIEYNKPSKSANKNELAKVGSSFKSEQNAIDEPMDVDGESVVTDDDEYTNYSCENLQDLLDLNKKLMESLEQARERMVALLAECTKKKHYIDDQISLTASSWQSKIVSFNAGMPYFKDKNYYTAKRNEDTETKIRNGELRLTGLQRIHRWSQLDKSNLLKAIRYEVTLTLLRKDEPEEVYIDNSITKTSHLPVDVKKAIGSLGSMKFDWLKIANDMPENKHSAEECEVMWNVFLHPDINKQRWTSKEDKNLNRVVEEYDFEDWDGIAKELNTNRSGYQCFVRYNTNNWKNLMKGQSWSPVDDRMLIHLVTKLKMGDYIPWGYIASCMCNWTKQQVYFRWNYSLAPNLKKGRFSPEEDQKLLYAVEKYGPNFSKISILEMNSRTNIQLKDHYRTLLARDNYVKKIWKAQEDVKLLELHKKYGCNWATIIKEIPGTTRVEARCRYRTLMRYHRKGIAIDNIARENPEPSLNHTTMTYTSNSPWNGENKEIHVKHLKIDDQLINFFKKDNMIKKIEKMKKVYDIEELEEDTKKVYNALQKFNANLCIPDVIYDENEMSEKNLQLLISLQSYMEEQKTHFNENIEYLRCKMFGHQELLPEKQRFIPPLPFGFCKPRSSKKNVSDTIDYNIDTNEFNQIELVKILQTDKCVSEYIGEDDEYEFEKLQKVMTNKDSIRPNKVYSLKCKPFANSVFFDEEDREESLQGEINSLTNTDFKQTKYYDWESNKMVNSTSLEEEVKLEGVPLQVLEPSKSTLQAYQELLLTSRSFPSTSCQMHKNYKLTLRGRNALSLMKRRYQQLFHIPTGLCRIIPPDIVDESAFLPALEKFKKKNLTVKNKKKKRLNE